MEHGQPHFNFKIADFKRTKNLGSALSLRHERRLWNSKRQVLAKINSHGVKMCANIWPRDCNLHKCGILSFCTVYTHTVQMTNDTVLMNLASL